MKVKDLIKKLKQFDKEMEVRIEEEIYEHGEVPEIYYHEISGVFTDIEYDDEDDEKKIVVIRW